jgi:hypothetical protein
MRHECAAGVFDLFFSRKGKNMKKLLALALTLASGLVASPVAAKANETSLAPAATVSANAAPQWQQNQGGWGRRNNRRVRVVTQSRLVRVGRAIYRETYQVRYMPNGRTVTRLISRVRVR